MGESRKYLIYSLIIIAMMAIFCTLQIQLEDQTSTITDLQQQIAKLQAEHGTLEAQHTADMLQITQDYEDLKADFNGWKFPFQRLFDEVQGEVMAK